MVKPVGAPERVDIVGFNAFGREPIGPFPAEPGAHGGAGIDQFLIHRRGFGGPACGPLFHWEVVDEDVLVSFFVFQFGKMFGGHAEPPRIDADHVDGGFAIDDPMGELPAGAARGGHAKRVAFRDPEIGQAKGWADHRVAIRRVADRAVHNVLDAGILKAWNPFHAGFDMGHQPLKIAFKQVLFEGWRHTIDKTGGCMPFIRPKDPAIALFAEIILRIAFAQHRQFVITGFPIFFEHGIDVGDDILMFDRDGGDFEADHFGGGAGIVAARADHMLAADAAFGGRNDPLIIVAADAGHFGVLLDFGTIHPGAFGHGHGDINGCDVAVGRVPERANEIMHGGQRPQFFDLINTNQMAFHADRLGGALIVAVFIHPVIVAGQPQVAIDVKTHCLPGFCFQLLVQLDRILVQLANRIGHVEERQESGRVPGRACSQFGALEQNAV